MMAAIEELSAMVRRLPAFALAVFLLMLPCVSAAQLAERVVDLTASDGTKLKATYFAAGKPGPGVLLLHQCNRQRKVWDGLASQLAAAGINVLTFDLRGFGESGGEPLAKLTPQQAATEMAKGPGDIDTALQYLWSQPGVNRTVTGVGGASCGVNNSVQAARRHPEVKSLVLLSGNADLNGRNYLRSPAAPPVFYAIADDDEFPPSVIAIEWLYSITDNPGKTLVHYPTGGHGADMFKVHPELTGLIVDWYVTTLIKTPGRAPASKQSAQVPKEVEIFEEIDLPGGAAKVAQKLEQARQHDPKATLFPEDLVNIMGYEHLQAGDKEGAIAILKLNVAAYPNSPNVYDSLSDAYLADGHKELARQNARRALELLSSDTADPEARRNAIRDSAQQKLKQLGDPSK
jgi:dienelactone hydrolase